MVSESTLLRRDLFVFMVVGIALICLFVLSGGFGIASAEPMYDVVVVADYAAPNSTSANDLTSVSDTLFTVFNYGPDKKVSLHAPEDIGFFEVESTGTLLCGAYNEEDGYLYLQVSAYDGSYKHRFEKCLPDGSDWSAYMDYADGYDYNRAIAFYDGVIYGIGSMSSSDFGVLFRQPYYAGTQLIPLHDLRVGFDDTFNCYGLAFLDDGSFIVYEHGTTYPYKLYHFDSAPDYTLLMSWNATPIAEGTPSINGIAFDSAGYLWLIGANPDYLYKCYLPHLGEGQEETYNVTVVGKTRDVFGNIVPAVNVHAEGEDTVSNSIGDYELCLEDVSGVGITANLSGYHNYSRYLLIDTDGVYVHDIYMVPENALDAGEFGGVVYDYCTQRSIQGAYVYLVNETADSGKYAYTNKYGFYRFAGLAPDLDYKVSASKDGYDGSIVHSFTFNESNVNETHRKTKSIWLLPEGGCPEDGGIPTPPPAPTTPPHEWTNEEIVSWLRVNLMGMFIIVLIFTFLWFIRKAGGSKR